LIDLQATVFFQKLHQTSILRALNTLFSQVQVNDSLKAKAQELAWGREYE